MDASLIYPYISNIANHYADVIMVEMASQITSLAIVYSIVFSDADQRKHQSSASLAFVRGIHRGPVNSPHKWTVTRKMFPFDDVIMQTNIIILRSCWIIYTLWKLSPSAYSRSFRILMRYIKHVSPYSLCCEYIYNLYTSIHNIWVLTWTHLIAFMRKY